MYWLKLQICLKNIFNSSVIDVWNKYLPNSLVHASSVNIFERRLDKFWQNKDIRYEVLRDTAVVLRCHPLFQRPVPHYLPGKASFKLCYVMFG